MSAVQESARRGQFCERAEAEAEEKDVDADAVDRVEANAERDDEPAHGVQKACQVPLSRQQAIFVRMRKLDKNQQNEATTNDVTVKTFHVLRRSLFIPWTTS